MCNEQRNQCDCEHHYTKDTTDIQPLVGQTLESIKDIFSQLCRQYGSNAVLSNITFDGDYPCVEVEIEDDEPRQDEPLWSGTSW